ncbi:hypothetical protein PV08_05635 [Exophiala spinifera]|uniref:C2H2-type domain-containing protein n=1 Tax=Exophiala spinifera TaxID=91928 RepID=A0A0D1ZS27_9EURO|nr:uncharacterized protein PV08_05635 [Exophiala spinifera]KIW15587.1 hypothetical protein PV08_05635 [Exophiala spinifera]
MATQVISAPPAHHLPQQFGYDSDMMSSYHQLESFPSAHGSYTSEHSRQPLLMVSPPNASSDIPFRRRSSHSPRSGLVAPVSHNRTPIRHNRGSVMNDRSHTRGDMIMSYAAEENTLYPSQSLPSTVGIRSQSGPSMAQMYGMSAYPMSPPLASFGHQGGYFGSQLQSNVGQPESGEFPLTQGEGEIQNFYTVGRTSSQGSAMSLPNAESPNAMYLTRTQGHQSLPSVGVTMQPFPPVPSTLESSPAESEIMPSRPKPQCWDHGCNGRQFSTFSNLLRHQREKSGSATKAICPHCGTEFTRTTARNGHMSGGKCKGKPTPGKS